MDLKKSFDTQNEEDEEEEEEEEEEDSPLKLRKFLETQNGDGGDDHIDEEDILAPAPPDGGWGWVVCAASFLCNMILGNLSINHQYNHFKLAT